MGNPIDFIGCDLEILLQQLFSNTYTKFLKMCGLNLTQIGMTPNPQVNPQSVNTSLFGTNPQVNPQSVNTSLFGTNPQVHPKPTFS